jgi:hypothetical protein
MGQSLSLVDKKLAAVWIKGNNETADSSLYDISSERNRMIAKPRNLGGQIANLKGYKRAGNRYGMIRVCPRDGESGIPKTVLNPIVAHRGTLSLQHRIVEATRG